MLLVLLVDRVEQDRKDLKEQPETEVIKEELHHKDLRVIEDLKVLWDTKEPLDYMDYKDRKVREEIMDLPGRQEQEDLRVPLDIQGAQVL